MIRLSIDNTHITQIILDQAKKAKLASFKQRSISTTQKNHALKEIADSLFKNSNKIIDANRLDMDALMIDNPTVSNVIKNRLLLTPEKINAIAKGVMDIINLPDPIGEVVKMTVRPNGLRIGKIRIPIGVICCIYESRPNVTVDIAALALKSGNACILRGGKESLHTNIVLSNLIKEAVQSAGISPDFLRVFSRIRAISFFIKPSGKLEL